ncbi:M14 family zinc carboxypeptidase [Streptomyces sp. NPDC020883]|uniref:M14 family zinc carboxypeptidase n=1 Tax=Streptomyces sp. NPDC020883 TaxID=3365099 RepID=UPI0037B8208E
MSYLNNTEVDSALTNLSGAYPTLCEVVDLPERSVEGVACRALRLGAAPAGSRDCVVLIGGVHAREWGSCEILVFFAADLLRAYSTHSGLAYGAKKYTAAQVKAMLDAFPRTRWFIDVHSFSEDILYVWGDDQDQSDNPSMNFLNHAFDGVRGDADDARYREFIPGIDFEHETGLARDFQDGLHGVRGRSYTAKSGFDLYPTCGTSDDYAYGRHFVDPSKERILAYTIEWGTEFQPPWNEMENIIKDVDAGLAQFCVKAPSTVAVPTVAA